MSIVEPIVIDRTVALTGIGGAALLRTPGGLRRAENVAPGTLIVTRDNGLQPVRMVFTTILRDAVRLGPDNAAICLGPRAIGPMMPRAPLILAPDQRVLLPAHLLSAPVAGPGGLIAARALAGTSDLAWRDRMQDAAPLVNLVFDRHEVIAASGVFVESYRPAADEVGLLDEALRDRLLRAYPQLREKRDAFPPCAYEVVPPEAYLPSSC